MMQAKNIDGCLLDVGAKILLLPLLALLLRSH
jgi:hypothetical protein